MFKCRLILTLTEEHAATVEVEACEIDGIVIRKIPRTVIQIGGEGAAR